jgi:hypothetical protein
MSQQLPARPNLDLLKKQAKDVLQVFRRQKPWWKLADAQRAVARGYGFTNWPSLKTHVEKIRHEQLQPDHSYIVKTFETREESNSDGRSVHPIAGAWVAHRVMTSIQSDPQSRNEDIGVEFQLSADEIKLTQVATDAAGHEIAIKTTICADGYAHPVPFGEGVRLKAVWTTSLTLDVTFITSDGSLSRWSYEVSPDGKSLVLSTAKDRIVFKRL